jgi:nicotinate-nucleotide adenylyltransferase
MRIGVFGGTFDPVHLAHLVVAEQCREQARLDRVLFIPAARPPHKPERVLTPFERRVEMLALALAGQPAFQIAELEKDRPGPSYTVDTLEALREQHPNAEFCLLMGADMLADLPHWRAPVRVLELATLLVVRRLGWPVLSVEQVCKELGSTAAVRVENVEVPLLEIASRDIRRRVAEARSIRYLVPRSVEVYVAQHQLYRTGAEQ